MSDFNAKIIIENRQRSKDDSDCIKVEAPCKYMKKGDIVYILYTNEGVTSKIKTDGQTVTVTRMGEFSNEMVYKSGEITSFLYKTPYGTIDMQLKTNKAVVDFTEHGGKVLLCYELLFSGEKTENSMNITVSLKQKGDRTHEI